MNRRLLILGGIGILSGIAYVADRRVELRRSSIQARKTEDRRPTLVFVGHDL